MDLQVYGVLAVVRRALRREGFRSGPDWLISDGTEGSRHEETSAFP